MSGAAGLLHVFPVVSDFDFAKLQRLMDACKLLLFRARSLMPVSDLSNTAVSRCHMALPVCSTALTACHGRALVAYTSCALCMLSKQHGMQGMSQQKGPHLNCEFGTDSLDGLAHVHMLIDGHDVWVAGCHAL